MPRATTKNDLLKMANEKFDNLWNIIEGMSEEEQNADFCFDAEKMGNEAHWKRDKNIRDVLAHLYEWHQLLIEWERSNTSGAYKQFLLEGYSWTTYGAMNVVFWEKHQETRYDDSKKMLKESHTKVINMIEKYNEEQLFTKSKFKWIGKSSLAQYCISATASHYDWAIKKLKAQIKHKKTFPV